MVSIELGAAQRMTKREQLARVKAATVAIATVRPSVPAGSREPPFSIVGSGFCIESSGTIVTCEHVISAFNSGDVRQAVAAIPAEDRTGETWPVRGLKLSAIPHVIFFRSDEQGENLHAVMVPVHASTAKLSFDLGVIIIKGHAAFPNGYPALDVEPFENVFEGMEVATCGFPLGDSLRQQLGTLTSSLTRGIVSSILPAAGAREELVWGFQLDMTATFGNSGGPVFSWDSGKVIGVLQGGPQLAPGVPLQGIARAESIYRFLRDGILERSKT
jgi:serine protease Do